MKGSQPKAKSKFVDEKLLKLLQGQALPGDNFNVSISLPDKTNSRALYQIETQQELAHEYIQLLGLCHECVLDFNEETHEMQYQVEFVREI